MSVFSKVTLEILKKNKVRTIVTIIGIILSASMFTAVTTTVSSLQNYLLQNAIYNYGDWHVASLEVDESFFDFLKNPTNESEYSMAIEEGKVESYVYSQQLGYAMAEGCINEYKPYLYIIGADQDFCENMPVHLTGGRLPQASDEILLPAHLAENGGVIHKIGDVLTLEIGNRVSEGDVLGQNNPYMNAEEKQTVEGSDVMTSEEVENLEVQEKRTYTVVGFYERPNFENFSAPGYTAITVMDKVRPEGSLYNVYFKMQNSKDAVYWFNYMTCGSDLNQSVLSYLGVSIYEGFYTVLYGLAAVVIGLIMFGSVSLIYNAFSISVSERTKQFGLLSSIGATKKQLRQMVLTEGLFVGAVGIPLGILAGVGGMGVTFFFVGEKISSLTDYAMPLTLYVHPGALVAACVITLVTILISAWVPSKRATMVTAVEAIRQSGDVKLGKGERREMKKQTVLSHDAVKKSASKEMAVSRTTLGEKIVYRFFGLPGMIADKYYKRSKRKYRATVVSLFMSIVLFVSASALSSYLTEMVGHSFANNGYDISYMYTLSEYEEAEPSLTAQELAELFADAQGVTEVALAKIDNGRVDIDTQYVTEDYQEIYKMEQEESGLEIEEGKVNIFFSAVFVEDSIYEAFLQEMNLDKEIYMNPEKPLAIAFDVATDFNYKVEKYITYDVLKGNQAKVNLENGEGVSVELEAGMVLEERPYYISEYYDLVFLYPYSMQETVLKEFYDSNKDGHYYVKSENHAESFDAMKNILVEHGLSKNFLYDEAEGLEENRNLILIINVFSYGFIVLISLIAAANVFNTISTNISLRRREFAMLKSVGMSHREINRMLNFECILYGSKALLYGIPVSILITVLIYSIVSAGYMGDFYLPWNAIIIAMFSVFLVVFATMLYAMRKIKTENPIDALKNENL